MAKTVTGQIFGRYRAGYIGLVMCGQPVMTACNLFDRLPKNKTNNTKLDVTRRGFRGCK